MDDSLQALQSVLRDFARERDWEQFHSPKNLAVAMSIEAAELLEHFQWLPEEASYLFDADKKEGIGEELADVFLYLLQLSDKLQIDLIEAAQKKVRVNALKYPVERAKGSSRKYTDL